MKHQTLSKEQIQLYFEATQIPICCFEEENLIFRCTHPLQDYNLPLLLFASMPASLPPVWYSFTPEFLYFGGLRIPDSPWLLLLGPVLLSACSVKQADAICQRIGRKRADFSAIQSYLSATGPHRVPSLLANLRILGRLLGLRIPEEIPLLPFVWKLPYSTVYHTLPTELSAEDNEDLEKQLLSCVRTGNTAMLNQYLSTKLHDADSALQQGMKLTSMRSYILGANMLAFHTAHSAGADYAQLSIVADKYIEQILQARTTTDLTHLFFRFFQEYTGIVAKLQELPSGSPIVRSVHQYIRNHYSEKITPTVLAAALHLNVSYLCTHFKEETGMTISAYVQREKIREAKCLLEGSKESVTAISASLGFSSQSYFCEIFKKHTGMTPQTYRLSL